MYRWLRREFKPVDCHIKSQQLRQGETGRSRKTQRCIDLYRFLLAVDVLQYIIGKSNLDTFEFMTDEWYSPFMVDPENRKRKFKAIKQRLEDLFTLVISESSIADLGSGNGAMLVALNEEFKIAEGYEARKHMVESSYLRESVFEYNVLNPLPKAYDYVNANVLMYFSEEELNMFFKNNKDNFKVLINTYRFEPPYEDDARINFLSKNEMADLAELYGLVFIEDTEYKNMSYMCQPEFLK